MSASPSRLVALALLLSCSCAGDDAQELGAGDEPGSSEADTGSDAEDESSSGPDLPGRDGPVDMGSPCPPQPCEACVCIEG
ncbi:MAG: hypothetical protein KC457_34615, partial [Myxococcales bacterium]|nr:hypothetical protein [Myxococcales bacterium]